MASVLLALDDDCTVWKEVCRFMERQGASRAELQPGMTVAGAVTDDFWMVYEFPTGERVDVAFDGFLGTSIFGEDAVVKRLAALFAEGRENG